MRESELGRVLLQFSEDNESESALIQRVLSDPDAFRTMFRRMHPRVFAYVAHRVGRADDAEDITADVFLRVMNGLDRFEYRGDGAFTAWLFQIAYREVARYFSRRKANVDIPLDDLPEIRADSPTPEQTFDLKEHFAAVRAAVAQLPRRRQEVVALKFYGGLRNREIAEVLGLDERTVASNLSRALDQLEKSVSAERSLLKEEAL